MNERTPSGITPIATLQCSNAACGAVYPAPAQQCTACGALLGGIVLNSRFRIETLLGRGGMGAVYRAQDLTLGRAVAVKALTPGIGTVGGIPEDLRLRFFREARLAAQLDHPNIVPVLHFESDGPFTYLVMPLFTGGTLANRLNRRQPTDPLTVLGWLRQIAAALDYAHQRPQPIVHRDVKPSNLLFHEDGRLCLADFGIARVATESGSSDITRTGVILGSLSYMAPEQISGRPLPASDQYSVGVMLYEALTGVLPFATEDTYALMMQHLNVTPVPPGELIPGLPRSVDAVVMRALAKDPAARFASVGALAAAFELALKQAPTVQVQAPRAPRPTAILPPEQESRLNDPRGDHPTEAATHLRSSAGWYPPAGAANVTERQMLSPRPAGQLPPGRRQNLWFIIPAAVLGVLLVCGLGLVALRTLSQTPKTHTQTTATSTQALPTATQNAGSVYTQTLLAAEQHKPIFQDALLAGAPLWSLQNGARFVRGVGLLLPGVSGEDGGGKDKQNSGGSAFRLLDLHSSFDVEIDVAYPGANAAYGFLFATTDRLSYGLDLGSNGSYAVFQTQGLNENSGNLQAGGTVPGLAIKRGQPYHLDVLVQGNQIALFLNQQYITVITLSSGSFTLSHIFALGNFASASSPAGDVTFKNLTIYPA
ncbi:MAG TPA: serine/threonine-protein kinase [Ktedonobacterales bacterium]